MTNGGGHPHPQHRSLRTQSRVARASRTRHLLTLALLLLLMLLLLLRRQTAHDAIVAPRPCCVPQAARVGVCQRLDLSVGRSAGASRGAALEIHVGPRASRALVLQVLILLRSLQLVRSSLPVTSGLMGVVRDSHSQIRRPALRRHRFLVVRGQDTCRDVHGIVRGRRG